MCSLLMVVNADEGGKKTALFLVYGDQEKAGFGNVQLGGGIKMCT